MFSDCEGFCRVNVGCVAWTLATKDNLDIPAQCVLYSAVGDPVPYPNCISGKVHRKKMGKCTLFPPLQTSDNSSWDCADTKGEFACTADFDNTRTIVYGMTKVSF